MLDITITSEHTGHWAKMLRSLALFSGPEASVHTQSLADFITTTSGFKFSVHNHPRCPKCGSAMWLSRIVSDGADFEKRTFKCPVCEVSVSAEDSATGQ